MAESVKPEPDRWPTPDWPESSPAEQGVLADRLLAGDSAIRAEMPGVLSFLVVRHGHLVFERYYGFGWRHLCQNVKSVLSKYVVPACVT